MVLKNKMYITKVILSCKTVDQVYATAKWICVLFKPDIYDRSDVELLELCLQQKNRIKNEL